MKEKINLDFCFKGNRTYVHGTDIFTKVSEHHNNTIQNIDIAFHDIALKSITFMKEKPEGREVKVTFRCLQHEEKIKLYGVENDNEITCRYEYIEEAMIDNSTVNIPEEYILLNTPTEYSFIEHIVAMNKALLENLYPEVNGKWYFTRLQLKENIDMSDISSLKLILKSNFQFKLTKTAILVNKKEVGFIYFSLIPKES